MALTPKTSEKTSGKSLMTNGGMEKLKRTKKASTSESTQMPISMKKIIQRGIFF